jgi:hypothetical protein
MSETSPANPYSTRLAAPDNFSFWLKLFHLCPSIAILENLHTLALIGLRLITGQNPKKYAPTNFRVSSWGGCRHA